MIYDIILRIRYAYDSPALGGRHLARLIPADLAGEQRLVAGRLDINPPPAERTDRLDFFGNAATDFAFRAQHDEISLTLRARVDRVGRALRARPSCRLADLAGVLAAEHSLAPDAPAHFRAASPMVPDDTDMAAYARRLISPDMTVAEAVVAVGTALHADMHYDPDATEVDTPMAEAFAARHGVCQDFSHIMIACLRSLGIPAGYVSGFLRTTPPPGKPRLEGADAMHAWVRAWCGVQAGWLDYDPTNAVLAGTDHIVVARGRDYSDVSPVKGVLRVSGRQRSALAVDVIPVLT